ncbi:hypothetical protein FRC03_011902 [Tulasnella sp. 419]|nr:hypothetical protein FRC03_011902 [Tulasnella sp. 419]
MRRPAYNIYYDPSDMPPFSKSKPQPPALDTDSKSATQLPTTSDTEPAPEFHIQPTPPSSTLT